MHLYGAVEFESLSDDQAGHETCHLGNTECRSPAEKVMRIRNPSPANQVKKSFNTSPSNSQQYHQQALVEAYFDFQEQKLAVWQTV